MSPVDIADARRLVVESKTATLSTLAPRVDGTELYPFGSLVAVATNGRGLPLLLLSSLAEHTKNLKASPRASLLYADASEGNPLANARVTLLGDVRAVPDDDATSARDAYLTKQPEARTWAGFSDFALYVMDLVEVRMVAGFGKMGWIAVDEYLALAPL
jgi:putative heme iron utilization protein